ncbi:uncharacterized protein LOC134186593 [Corticium candelabrum]|uniref:uncharacterized protein LOC134186593 n=1 Tax=Corticium candelabrum TaxID=121492 RepID=UPI002E2526B8|nr:uncharacterized protein LOC134186593 [Corticium candelabrum]
MSSQRLLLSDFLSHYNDERQQLCRLLDLKMDGKDWRSVAGNLGFTWTDVMLIDQKEREPTAQVLLRYSMENSKATVFDLHTILRKLSREDAMDVLEAVGFDVTAPTLEDTQDFYVPSESSSEESALTDSTTQFFPGQEEGDDETAMIKDMIAEFGVLNLFDLDKPVIGKVALLIGNQNYEAKCLELKTPHRDVRDLKKVLEDMDFKTMTLVDLRRDEMRQAILSFTTFLDRQMYAVFFFGGHGFEGHNPVTGDVENFLIPVDAPDTCSPEHCIKLQEDVLDTIQECNTAMNLIIADTCRTWKAPQAALSADSLKQKTRRSINLRSKGNTVFAFSTCSAKKAYEAQVNASDDSQCNSIYVKYLKQHLMLDDPVEQILKKTARAMVARHSGIQIPVIVTNLIRDCKLTDRVVPDEHTRHQLIRWTQITELPRYNPFSLKGFLFTPKFCLKCHNVLLMVLFVENTNNFAVRDLKIRTGQPKHGLHFQHEPCAPDKLAGTDDPPDRQRDCVTQISIGGLQRLEDGMSQLPLPLTMSYCDDTDQVPPGITVSPQEITFEIDLGNPLISAASANWDAFISSSYEQSIVSSEQ